MGAEKRVVDTDDDGVEDVPKVWGIKITRKRTRITLINKRIFFDIFDRWNVDTVVIPILILCWFGYKCINVLSGDGLRLRKYDQ